MQMKMFGRIVFAALVAINAPTTFAAKGGVVYKSGNWEVFRSVDSMNDAVSCTGIYKGDWGIQLTNLALYLSTKGGLELVKLRFDENQAKASRLPYKREKSLNAIIIDPPEYDELVDSNRLRVQYLALGGSAREFDIDLTGIKTALSNINAGCPIPKQPIAEPAPAPAKPVTVAEEKPQPPVCSEQIISRMKAQGIKEKQITAICKP